MASLKLNLTKVDYYYDTQELIEWVKTKQTESYEGCYPFHKDNSESPQNFTAFSIQLLRAVTEELSSQTMEKIYKSINQLFLTPKQGLCQDKAKMRERYQGIWSHFLKKKNDYQNLEWQKMFSLVGFMGQTRKNTIGDQNKKSFKSFLCEIFGFLSVLLSESARKTFMNFLLAFKMVK